MDNPYCGFVNCRFCTNASCSHSDAYTSCEFRRLMSERDGLKAQLKDLSRFTEILPEEKPGEKPGSSLFSDSKEDEEMLNNLVKAIFDGIDLDDDD